jgi:hypothetical protein
MRRNNMDEEDYGINLEELRILDSDAYDSITEELTSNGYDEYLDEVQTINDIEEELNGKK